MRRNASEWEHFHLHHATIQNDYPARCRGHFLSGNKWSALQWCISKTDENKYLRHKIINVSLSAAVLAKKVIFNGRKGVTLSLLFVFPCFSVQFHSVTQSCLTDCNPVDCRTPGFPVHHQLPELAQTHVLWVGDAIQPSNPLLSPSPPTLFCYCLLKRLW